VEVPVSLNDELLGPPGYQEAFLYQLALRLCRPFGKPIPPELQAQAHGAFLTMKRPNVEPALLGVDAALTVGTTGGYNVLSDQQSSPSGR
jgi:hypothetical protein